MRLLLGLMFFIVSRMNSSIFDLSLTVVSRNSKQEFHVHVLKAFRICFAFIWITIKNICESQNCITQTTTNLWVFRFLCFPCNCWNFLSVSNSRNCLGISCCSQIYMVWCITCLISRNWENNRSISQLRIKWRRF